MSENDFRNKYWRYQPGPDEDAVLDANHPLAGETLIGIEDDKPEAIAAMTAACAGTDFQVCPVPTRYPSGGAKQLTKLLTNKEAPIKGRSTDIGVQCFNVATAYTLHRAINHGERDLAHRHRHRSCAAAAKRGCAARNCIC
ncbi:MAG: hypothetical protein HC889_15440 [Synechococcaceae cyanobacterium SM1_2_3]|nr:hypothetical protein [Synechococcaceae cyanobacterium SM1_2_3]